jgi:hypothetical protein
MSKYVNITDLRVGESLDVFTESGSHYHVTYLGGGRVETEDPAYGRRRRSGYITNARIQEGKSLYIAFDGDTERLRTTHVVHVSKDGRVLF